MIMGRIYLSGRNHKRSVSIDWITREFTLARVFARALKSAVSLFRGKNGEKGTAVNGQKILENYYQKKSGHR